MDSSTPEPIPSPNEQPGRSDEATESHDAKNEPQEASKREFFGVVAIGVLMVFGFAIIPPKDGPIDWVDGVLFFSGVSLLSVAVFYMIIREYQGTARRDARLRILSLIVLILGMIIFFALSFYRLSTISGEIEGLQTHLDAVYFTISTAMTVGFGDVVARGQIGRFVVIVQMLFNIVVLAAASKLVIALLSQRTKTHVKEQE